MDHTEKTIAGMGRRNLLLFTLTLTLTAAALVGLGWLSGIRDVAHHAMLSVMVFAFLPFCLIAVGIGVMLLGCVSFLFGGSNEGFDGGAEAVSEGIGLIPKYYQFLSERKHPVFWGIPCGVFVGALALMVLAYPLIVKKESATLATMARLQNALAVYQTEHGGYPQPDVEGRLRLADLGLPEVDGPFALDGFGRPLVYLVQGTTTQSKAAETGADEQVEATPTTDSPTPETAVSETGEGEGEGESGWAALGAKVKAGMADMAKKGMDAAAEKVKAAGARYVVASYRLESYGYDGQRGADDLIVRDATPMHKKWEELKTKASKPSTWINAGRQAKKILDMRRGEEP